MKLDEFHVDSNGERVKATLASPTDGDASDESALLINISATTEYALHDENQNHPTPIFLDAGHYVVSFDLPCHGERVGEFGESLPGMGVAYVAGVDMFEQFVADGVAVMDACQKRGIGANGRIVSYGVSRAGYCLLRLAAADPRLRAVAASSPCVDWGVPEEFTQSCPRTSTWPLLLEHWVDQLGDTATYLSVGSQDDIVSTQAVVRFAMKLFEKQRQVQPEDRLISELHVVASPGHSPSRKSRLDATRFLLERAGK